MDISKVTNFVCRMYVYGLGREADNVGLTNWVSVLMNGTYSGAMIAREFILSPEFKNRNLSDEEFVRVLYLTFFDREPDEGGFRHWLHVLGAKFSREFVLSSFVDSTEFSMICKEYDIYRGIMFENGEVPQMNTVRFVERLYLLILERECDLGGLLNWTKSLHYHIASYRDVATALMTCEEYKLKYISDKRFLRDLYKVFMDRKADESGLNHWMTCLTTESREWVIARFSESIEFNNLITTGVYRDVDELRDEIDIAFFGDSITVGAKVEEYQYYSWSNYVEDHSTLFDYVYNFGAGGWNISDILDDKGNQWWIQKRVDGAKHHDFDYVILSGGLNDIGSNVPLGRLDVNDFSGSYDTSTFIGALENYIYTSKQYWSDAKIGYIITYKPSQIPGLAHLSIEKINPYISMMYTVFSKWHIPYIDLYDDTTTTGQSYDNLLGMQEKRYTSDGVHITKEGYDVLSPHILEWIESL